MEQYGFLIIMCSFVKLTQDGRVRMMPVQVSKVHVTRTEALEMMREHKRQVNSHDPAQHYDYSWQCEREDWNNI